ncbi:Arf guanine nucleotide exchange factor sbh1 [Exophiala xenobiotica]|nr:Arf guanine nucleotide exchange factor sbh1 [Exophiala xenobiotica]
MTFDGPEDNELAGVMEVYQASPRPSSPLTSGPDSGPDSTPSAAKSSGSSSIARAGSPPGGPRSAIRRRAAADHKESVKNARPASTRAAGAGGSSGTMLRLYTDESPGLKVDPMVILFLSLGFIFSVVALHLIAKITKRFS